ncbi:hypothetical protein BH10ACI1_BH10ACI1_23200 [soil metagenome]
MYRMLAYIYKSICREFQSGETSNTNESASSGGSEKVAISLSVGLRSPNLPIDVTKIQNALNRISPDDGGPAIPLIPNGFCDSRTVEVIQKFQLRHFGWSGADGIINPNGQTIARINEVLSSPYVKPPSYAPDAPEVQEAFKRVMEYHVAEARRWVFRTRTELMTIAPFIDDLDSTSKSYRDLNECFAIDQAPDRRLAVRKILQVYDDMERAFQRHQSQLRPVFEVYRLPEVDVIAFTTAGGFYAAGVEVTSREFGKTFNDRIYLMPSQMVFMTKTEPVAYTSILIHEMAHYVGGWHSVGTIEDWNPEGSHSERMRSASAYQLYPQSVIEN